MDPRLEAVTIQFEAVATLAIALFRFDDLIPEPTDHLWRKSHHWDSVTLSFSFHPQEGTVNTRQFTGFRCFWWWGHENLARRRRVLCILRILFRFLLLLVLFSVLY